MQGATTPAENPRFREDKAVDSAIPPREFSPRMEDGQFKAPKVFEQGAGSWSYGALYTSKMTLDFLIRDFI